MVVNLDSTADGQEAGAALPHSLSPLTLFPSIDIAGGQSVRLSRGDRESQESFGSPLEIAKTWIQSGAEWIHLVDLDAAYGTGQNQELISEVVKKCKAINVQVSGGIRDEQSFSAALATGASRINLATSALLDVDFVEAVISEYKEKVAVALDVKDSRLVARGTREDVGELFTVLNQLEQLGCERYIVTDITRDGALMGPNYDLLRSVMAETGKPVIASGGISGLMDIQKLSTLRSIGLEGAILGKALYVGRFSLQQALEEARS